MYTNVDTIVYTVDTDGATSGTKNFEVNDCSFCDLRELYRNLCDPSKEVIIRLMPTNGATMKMEKFYCTGEMYVGGVERPDTRTFVFACYSRSGSSVLNRKMVMHFVDMTEEHAYLSVDYYTT